MKNKVELDKFIDTTSAYVSEGIELFDEVPKEIVDTGIEVDPLPGSESDEAYRSLHYHQ